MFGPASNLSHTPSSVMLRLADGGGCSAVISWYLATSSERPKLLDFLISLKPLGTGTSMHGKLANFQALVTPDVQDKDSEWFEQQLSAVGASFLVEGGKINVQCPWHLERLGREDTGHDFVVDRFEGWGLCWSCGARGPWPKLAKKLGMLEVPTPHGTDKPSAMLASMARSITKMGIHEHKRDKQQNFTQPLVSEWKGNWRGFTGQWLRDQGCVKVDDLRMNVGRIGLPLRTYSGALRAYTCRAVDPPNAEPKYQPLHADRNQWHEKALPANDMCFLGEHVLRDKWKRVVLVEGPIDALRLWSLGIPALAILGVSNWSAVKRDGLIALGITHFLVLMDGDNAGQEAQEKILGTLRGTKAVGLVLPPDKDPGNLSEKQLNWVRNRLESM